MGKKNKSYAPPKIIVNDHICYYWWL